MSTVLPRIRVKRGNIGNELFVHLPDLNEFEKSFLSSDEAAGQTVLSVLSSENFKNDTYIVIGIPGTERAEIRLLTATGADTDGQLTVTVATTFNHPKGTLITFIPFNQLEISSASEVGGSYSVAATIDLQPDSLETYYQAGSDASTIAYKVRFKNVKDTEFSDFSDEVVGAGYADNTVFSIKKRALAEMGEEIGGTITDEVLNDSLWKARREVDNLVKKWSFRTSFNSVLGVVSEGQWRMAVPSTLRSPDSPDNILSIRLGTEGVPISYVSKRVFDERYAGGAHATVGTAITTSDITAVLDSVIGSGDFDESGTIDVGSDKGVTYTGNDEDTETLSGIPASGDGSFASNHAAGVDVWQDIQYGLPYQYTIFEDFISFPLSRTGVNPCLTNSIKQYFDNDVLPICSSPNIKENPSFLLIIFEHPTVLVRLSISISNGIS